MSEIEKAIQEAMQKATEATAGVKIEVSDDKTIVTIDSKTFKGKVGSGK